MKALAGAMLGTAHVAALVTALVAVLITVSEPIALAETPSGEAILAKVDASQSAESRITVWEMTIRGRRAVGA